MVHWKFQHTVNQSSRNNHRGTNYAEWVFSHSLKGKSWNSRLYLHPLHSTHLVSFHSHNTNWTISRWDWMETVTVICCDKLESVKFNQAIIVWKIDGELSSRFQKRWKQVDSVFSDSIKLDKMRTEELEQSVIQYGTSSDMSGEGNVICSLCFRKIQQSRWQTHHDIISVMLMILMTLRWVCIETQKSSSIIPHSESDVFWYLWYLIHWQVPLTSAMQFLFLWQLHFSQAVAATMTQRDFCQQSKPDVYIAPGNQMWPTVSVS